MSTNLATPNDENTQTITPVVPANESPEQTYQRLYGTVQSTGTTATSVVATIPTELTETLQALQAEIVSLKAQGSPAIPAASKLEWVEKIRQGDFDGAQASLVSAVQNGMAPRLESVRQQAYQDALAATQVNQEMERHLTKMRQENPDLIQFERYLQAPVAERVQLAQKAGRIRNPQDFVREYRDAVDGEVANLRNLGLQFRAAGKDEALTRNRQVISSSPLVPQQVQSTNQASQDSQNTSEGETTDSYFARRKADESRRRGLN